MNRLQNKSNSKKEKQTKNEPQDDIQFNNLVTEIAPETETITENPLEETISKANYDADIYDKSTDFKSIGVK
jgi:hypothetical protein